ncbi:MAG TPA: VOC family protein [Candidatus Polarisedimenticolia bacterium]|nr:VOC family protein [Candidatus Polarisedimenticolia bacterium]
MTSQKFFNVSPNLLVTDIVKAAEYFRDVLGFSFDRYWGEPPCFVMVMRDEVEFMLVQAGAPDQVRPNRARHPEASWDAYIRVQDSVALCEEFRSKGAKVIREPEVAFYEMKEFEIEACDGYIVCFGQDVGAA